MNAYEILGVREGCSPDELKKAYRRMTQQFHPDKNKSVGAEERFKLILEAYTYLTTGKSPTGIFTRQQSQPKPQPKPQPQWEPPPSTNYGIPKVKVQVAFHTIFGYNQRVQLPGTPFFVDVPKFAQMNKYYRVLAQTANYSHQMNFDIEFVYKDASGFHKVEREKDKYVLVSEVTISAGDLLSDVTLYLKNIDPNRSDVPVKITAKDRAVTVEGAGLPDETGRRGKWKINVKVEFKALEEERFDTLIALRDKVNALLRNYHR